jgi:mRNA interferase MazF
VKRGDLVRVALQGDQGKPRPALVVQADHFDDLASLTVRSQIMADKPQTPSRLRIGPVIDRLDDATMVTVNRMLAVFLGLA